MVHSRQEAGHTAVNGTELMLAAKSGDADAFGKLYATYRKSVYDFVAARGATRGHDDLEDIVQEVFLRAWRYRNKYRGQASALTFLLAIARNVHREACRAARRWPRNTQDCGDDEQPSRESLRRSAVQNALDARQFLATTVRLALSDLSQRQQQVIRLRLFEGLSIREVARRAGASTNAIRHRLSAAMNHLRNAHSVCAVGECPCNGRVPADCPAECRGVTCAKFDFLMTFENLQIF